MPRKRILILAFSHDASLGASAKALLEGDPMDSFQVTEKFLEQCGLVNCPQSCAAAIQRCRPDVILVCADQARDERTGFLLIAARAQAAGAPILVLISQGTPGEITKLLDDGADDYLIGPVRDLDLLPRLKKLVPAEDARPRADNLKERLGLKNFIGESPALMAAIQRIPAVAACDASVLITGETGTGKELCARAIHYLSSRSDKPFVPVNCGAIPLELVENELFGHEPGAFTGANSSSPGLLRAADGGTLLLDEIDALPLSAQVKLLRFLQEGQVNPLGSGKSYTANIRVIAASNAVLDDAVRGGKFRQDLYYRLNVVPIQMPPLRQRLEDIPLLARHFLKKYSLVLNKPAELTFSAIQKLMGYDWPGNIRELENIMERALILSNQPIIRAEDILLAKGHEADGGSFQTLKAKVVADFERRYIHQILLANDGNITKAADAAKKHRRAFWQLMRKHEIKPARETLLP